MAKGARIVEAVVRIFREQTELREIRTRARIKYLFMRHGWTAESMLAAIEDKLGYKLDAPVDAPEEPPAAPDDAALEDPPAVLEELPVALDAFDVPVADTVSPTSPDSVAIVPSSGA